MDKLIATMSIVINDDDDEISIRSLNAIAEIAKYPDISTFKERAKEWKNSHGEFLNRTLISYAKLFYVTSGDEKYLKENVEDWELDETVPIQLLVSYMYKTKFLYDERRTAEVILKEKVKLPEHCFTFFQYQPHKLRRPTPIQEKEEPPPPEKEAAELSEAEDENESLVSDKPLTHYHDFPFLNTPMPDGVFCDFITRNKINCILETNCFGNIKRQVNSLNPHEAWKLVDKKYLYPWVVDRVNSCPYGLEEDQEPSMKVIHDMVRDIKIEIRNISSYSGSPVESLATIQAITELKDQILSLGILKPKSAVSRPTFIPPEQKLFTPITGEGDVKEKPSTSGEGPKRVFGQLAKLKEQRFQK